MQTNPFIACTCRQSQSGMHRLCRAEFLLCTCILHCPEANGGYSDAVEGMSKIPAPGDVPLAVLHQLTIVMNDLRAYGDYLIYLLHTLFIGAPGGNHGTPVSLHDIMYACSPHSIYPVYVCV